MPVASSQLGYTLTMTRKWVLQDGQDKPLLERLLAHRGINSSAERETFFAKLESPAQVAELAGVRSEDLKRAQELVAETIAQKGKIIIHGDYDVDGICSAAILWEKLYRGLGYKGVSPFIPDRFSEGYGLTAKSIERLSQKFGPFAAPPLLLTVDCGITALEAVSLAREKGFRVLIVDHHTKEAQLPEASEILWTDQLCATGLAWLLGEELVASSQLPVASQLDLVALATIADLQPLLGANRLLVKAGLKELQEHPRLGLRALMAEAGLKIGQELGNYEVGWLLAPRLNAAGRLEDAMEALRLLLTGSEAQAKELARKLSETNAERQRLTLAGCAAANGAVEREKKILIVSSPDYHEGVIGLVAGKLVQEYYRPAVVISEGEGFSKGSARSVNGFNIVEAIRTAEDLLLDVGGHPMAAGFSLATNKIAAFRERLEAYAQEQLTEEDLEPELKIDAELKLAEITPEVYAQLQQLAPFGIGNPQPVFCTRGVTVMEARGVGTGGKHLKLLLSDQSLSSSPEKLGVTSAIGFGMGEGAGPLGLGDKVEVAYTILENTWNGQTKLELKLKDLRSSSS